MAGERNQARMGGRAALCAGALVAGLILFGAVHPVTSAAAAAEVTEVTNATTPSVAVPVASLPPVTLPPDPGTVAPPRVDVTGQIPRAVQTVTSAPTATTDPAGAPSTAPLPSPAGKPSPPAPSPAGPTTGPRHPTTTAYLVNPPTRALAVRLRQAAAETVQQLTFPLALVLMMLAFLVFQHHLDKGDPRVEASLESGDDDLLGFS